MVFKTAKSWRRYELTGENLTAWLAGETLSATVTPDTTKATLFHL